MTATLFDDLTPVANNIQTSTEAATLVDIDVSATGDDPTNSLGNEEIDIVNPPGTGAVVTQTLPDPVLGTVFVVGAVFTYTPNAGESGDDTFGYTITDTNGDVVSAEITVSVDLPADSDDDGVNDTLDNCINVPNGPLIPDAGGNSQYDSNGDGFGNMCDADLNNDLVINGLDVGPFVTQFGTSGPDADFNGDGVVNGLDVGPFVSMFGQAPGPSGLAP